MEYLLHRMTYILYHVIIAIETSCFIEWQLAKLTF